jgi:hypothetical protein
LILCIVLVVGQFRRKEMSMISEFVEKLRGRLKKELQLADEDKRKADVLQFDRAVGYANGMAIAIDILNQLAEEYKDVPDTNVGKWIPVSEKLPEERDWYLAVFKEPYTGFIGLPYIADYLLGKHTAYTTKEGWIIKDCTDGKDSCEYFKELECVAWQPLPEPYKD